MNSEYPAHGAPFPATHWSLVARANEGGAALDVLLNRYLPALRAYLVLERGLSADAADEVLQGFTASRILEQNILSHADANRGRFRTFLLAILKNYCTDELRAAAAQKRRPPGGATLAIDQVQAAMPARQGCDPFDVEWARQTLTHALQRMREACQQTGRADLWDLLRLRIIEPALTDAQPLPYEQIIARFGFRSPAEASNALTTAKRMFARVLRAIIQEYAPEPADVEQEIAELRAILATADDDRTVLVPGSLPPEAP